MSNVRVTVTAIFFTFYKTAKYTGFALSLISETTGKYGLSVYLDLFKINSKF
jgi:hypothetical protein